MAKHMIYRSNGKFPGNQPFNVTAKPNKTKKHSNMIIFKPKEQPKKQRG